MSIKFTTRWDLAREGALDEAGKLGFSVSLATAIDRAAIDSDLTGEDKATLMTALSQLQADGFNNVPDLLKPLFPWCYKSVEFELVGTDGPDKAIKLKEMTPTVKVNEDGSKAVLNALKDHLENAFDKLDAWTGAGSHTRIEGGYSGHANWPLVSSSLALQPAPLPRSVFKCTWLLQASADDVETLGDFVTVGVKLTIPQKNGDISIDLVPQTGDISDDKTPVGLSDNGGLLTGSARVIDFNTKLQDAWLVPTLHDRDRLAALPGSFAERTDLAQVLVAAATKAGDAMDSESEDAGGARKALFVAALAALCESARWGVPAKLVKSGEKWKWDLGPEQAPYYRASDGATTLERVLLLYLATDAKNAKGLHVATRALAGQIRNAGNKLVGEREEFVWTWLADDPGLLEWAQLAKLPIAPGQKYDPDKWNAWLEGVGAWKIKDIAATLTRLHAVVNERARAARHLTRTWGPYVEALPDDPANKPLLKAALQFLTQDSTKWWEKVSVPHWQCLDAAGERYGEAVDMDLADTSKAATAITETLKPHLARVLGVNHLTKSPWNDFKAKVAELADEVAAEIVPKDDAADNWVGPDPKPLEFVFANPSLITAPKDGQIDASTEADTRGFGVLLRAGEKGDWLDDAWHALASGKVVTKVADLKDKDGKLLVNHAALAYRNFGGVSEAHAAYEGKPLLPEKWVDSDELKIKKLTEEVLISRGPEGDENCGGLSPEWSKWCKFSQLPRLGFGITYSAAVFRIPNSGVLPAGARQSDPTFGTAVPTVPNESIGTVRYLRRSTVGKPIVKKETFPLEIGANGERLRSSFSELYTVGGEGDSVKHPVGGSRALLLPDWGPITDRKSCTVALALPTVSFETAKRWVAGLYLEETDEAKKARFRNLMTQMESLDNRSRGEEQGTIPDWLPVDPAVEGLCFRYLDENKDKQEYFVTIDRAKLADPGDPKDGETLDDWAKSCLIPEKGSEPEVHVEITKKKKKVSTPDGTGSWTIELPPLFWAELQVFVAVKEGVWSDRFHKATRRQFPKSELDGAPEWEHEDKETKYLLFPPYRLLVEAGGAKPDTEDAADAYSKFSFMQGTADENDEEGWRKRRMILPQFTPKAEDIKQYWKAQIKWQEFRPTGRPIGMHPRDELNDVLNLPWDALAFIGREGDGPQFQQPSWPFPAKANGPVALGAIDTNDRLGERYFRFQFTLWHRYACFYGNDDALWALNARRIHPLRKSDLDPWNRHLVRGYRDRPPPSPITKFVIPLTQPAEEKRIESSAVGDQMVLLNEPVGQIGGLAEFIEFSVVPRGVMLTQVFDKDKKPLRDGALVGLQSRHEFGNDPILRASTNNLGQTPVPVVTGPIGHTFDPDVGAPLFGAASFIIGYPDAQLRDLYQLRARRVLDPEGMDRSSEPAPINGQCKLLAKETGALGQFVVIWPGVEIKKKATLAVDKLATFTISAGVGDKPWTVSSQAHGSGQIAVLLPHPDQKAEVQPHLVESKTDLRVTGYRIALSEGPEGEVKSVTWELDLALRDRLNQNWVQVGVVHLHNETVGPASFVGRGLSIFLRLKPAAPATVYYEPLLSRWAELPWTPLAANRFHLGDSAPAISISGQQVSPHLWPYYLELVRNGDKGVTLSAMSGAGLKCNFLTLDAERLKKEPVGLFHLLLVTSLSAAGSRVIETPLGLYKPQAAGSRDFERVCEFADMPASPRLRGRLMLLHVPVHDGLSGLADAIEKKAFELVFGEENAVDNDAKLRIEGMSPPFGSLE